MNLVEDASKLGEDLFRNGLQQGRLMAQTRVLEALLAHKDRIPLDVFLAISNAAKGDK
jgi:hypothetical protein